MDTPIDALDALTSHYATPTEAIAYALMFMLCIGFVWLSGRA